MDEALTATWKFVFVLVDSNLMCFLSKATSAIDVVKKTKIEKALDDWSGGAVVAQKQVKVRKRLFSFLKSRD